MEFLDRQVPLQLTKVIPLIVIIMAVTLAYTTYHGTKHTGQDITMSTGIRISNPYVYHSFLLLTFAMLFLLEHRNGGTKWRLGVIAVSALSFICVQVFEHGELPSVDDLRMEGNADRYNKREFPHRISAVVSVLSLTAYVLTMHGSGTVFKYLVRAFVCVGFLLAGFAYLAYVSDAEDKWFRLSLVATAEYLMVILFSSCIFFGDDGSYGEVQSKKKVHKNVKV